MPRSQMVSRRVKGSGTARTLACLCVGSGLVLGLLGTVAAGASVGTLAKAQSAPTATVWLCRPGLANDPCTANLNATSIASNGSTTVVPAKSVRNSRFDCFYVYPTVSEQLTDNSNLK